MDTLEELRSAIFKGLSEGRSMDEIALRSFARVRKGEITFPIFQSALKQFNVGIEGERDCALEGSEPELFIGLPYREVKEGFARFEKNGRDHASALSVRQGFVGVAIAEYLDEDMGLLDLVHAFEVASLKPSPAVERYFELARERLSHANGIDAYFASAMNAGLSAGEARVGFLQSIQKDFASREDAAPEEMDLLLFAIHFRLKDEFYGQSKQEQNQNLLIEKWPGEETQTDFPVTYLFRD